RRRRHRGLDLRGPGEDAIDGSDRMKVEAPELVRGRFDTNALATLAKSDDPRLLVPRPHFARKGARTSGRRRRGRAHSEDQPHGQRAENASHVMALLVWVLLGKYKYDARERRPQTGRAPQGDCRLGPKRKELTRAR